MLQWKPMLAIQLSRQIRRSITYVQSDFSTFVGKLTKWLYKFMSFPAFQCFLTWKNMALKHICRNPGSTERTKGIFDFFDFRNARISPKDKDGCAMSPQVFRGNEDNSPNFRTKSNNPPLVWQAPHCMFHRGTCRQPCGREQVVLFLKGEQRNECWSSAMTYIWHCISLALLSGAALLRSTKTF